ncbi:MAG: hypothetical protein KDD94_00620 [Calditrichaeota bacterium]|nr:hypothetical protein [Calditrichota bacterium]
MSSAFIHPQEQNRFSIAWIVDKKNDLTWFIGGALAAYFMYYLHSGLHMNMVTIWFWWVVLLDTPHFFGTYLRTYLDKEEFQKRKKLLLLSLLWLLAGPAVFTVSYLLYKSGASNYKFPFFAFIMVFNIWAYWHVVRQHYGIMSLYKRKNNDFHPIDNLIDKSLLYVGLLAPFIVFIFRHPDARELIGLNRNLDAFPGFSATSIFSLNFEQFIIVFAGFMTFLVSIAYLSRLLYLVITKQTINIPKLLFFLALIPLYIMINMSDAILTISLLGFSILVTIYHDIQYHAIVWYYSKNRYHKEADSQARFGMAARISKNLFSYFVWAIGMGIIMRFAGCFLELHPGCGPLFASTTHPLFGEFTFQELLFSILIGIPMHHYFVDQFIWRPSRDNNLRNDLKIKTAK